MDISIRAALGRDGVSQGSAVMSGCRSPGIACACVHTDDSDITEERDPPSSTNSQGAWGCNDVHAPSVRRARRDMRIP